MTIRKRLVCHQNLEDFAKGLIAHAKNGPRAVFRQITDGPVGEVTYSEIPADGQNYAKIMKHMPECLYGIYDHRITVKELVSDLSFKGC